METKINYTAVGLFVVILASVSFYFAFWISNRNDKTLYDTYIVIFSEPVTGLTSNSTVTFNGVSVGYVEKIDINPRNPRQVMTHLSILRNTPLNSSATARLRSQGITGISYIDITIKDAEAPALRIKEGDRFPVIVAEPSLFTTFESVLEDLRGSIENIGDQLDLVFNKETMSKINTVVENVEHSSDLLAHQLLPQISKVTSRIEQITINIEQLSDDLRRNPSAVLHGNPTVLGPGE